MSSRRLGPKRGASASGRLRLAARAQDRRAARHHGAGAAVVADRQVAPVRQQRLDVGAEQAAEVRRVLDRRVEVDVVGDLERQVQRRRRRGRSRARRRARRPPPTPAGPAAISGVQRGSGEDAGPTAARSSTRSPSRAPTRGGWPGGEKTPSGRVTAAPAPADPRPARERARADRDEQLAALGGARAERGGVGGGEDVTQLGLVGAGGREVGGGEEVQEPVLVLGADGMMQAGGGLERQLEVAGGDEERRHLLDARDARAAAAQLALRTRRRDSGQRVAPVVLERHLAEQLDAGGLEVGRPDHLDRLDPQPGGRPVAAVEHGADRGRALLAQFGGELGEPRRGAHETGQHPGVLARAGAGVLRHGRGHVETRGREERRVVDEAG